MESDLLLLARGVAIGFALAAPVGPVGILCIRRSLSDGLTRAFVAALGAAVADTFFGAVVGLGLTVVSAFLFEHAAVLRLLGGGFLLILGARTYRNRTCIDPQPSHGPGLVKDFISTFLITLTNPATILAFMGVFAAFGALGANSLEQSGIVIGGVFIGSALWWLVLSSSAAAVRAHFTPHWLIRLNHVSGILLIVFGIGILASLAITRLG